MAWKTEIPHQDECTWWPSHDRLSRESQVGMHSLEMQSLANHGLEIQNQSTVCCKGCTIIFLATINIYVGKILISSSYLFHLLCQIAQSDGQFGSLTICGKTSWSLCLVLLSLGEVNPYPSLKSFAASNSFSFRTSLCLTSFIFPSVSHQ